MARILVVDDDPDILKMADAILTSAGHTVFTAEDAMRAMDWLNHIQFDLLLSDANMPQYSGFELVATIRKDPKFVELSIAMLTGLRERKDVERALQAGVDDYIVKPLDPLLLVQKVTALFQKRPPNNYPEIKLATRGLGQGYLQRPVTVDSVSELGVRVISELPLKPGMVIDIHAQFFASIDVIPPPMKVLNAETDPHTGHCHAQLIFLGAGEPVLQKIRKWLYSHGATRNVG
ncbi:MAG TPA: response regulator [Bdellovibrionales bacterium]|nr:response regulator [Bdellovibrionales bacterium]